MFKTHFLLQLILLLKTFLSLASATTIDPETCSTVFKGSQVSFTHCVLTLVPNFELYYTVSEDGKTIDTLFRGLADDYTAFAWGYPSMYEESRSPFHTIVATRSEIKTYVMNGRSQSLVVPNDTVSSALPNINLTFDASNSTYIAARFTRPLESDDLSEDQLPTLKLKENSSFIWATGNFLETNPVVLDNHGNQDTNRGVGSALIDTILETSQVASASPDASETDSTPQPSPESTFESVSEGTPEPNVDVQSPSMEPEVSVQPNSSCEVQFGDETLTYAKCELEKLGPVQLYYTFVNSSDNPKIETLFQAQVSNDPRYVAFGWGYSEMVVGNGSVVLLASTTNGSDARLKRYTLTGQFESAVKTVNISLLVNDGAVIKDGMLTARFEQPLSGSQLPNLSSDDVDFIWAVGGMPRNGDDTPVSNHGRGEALRGAGSVNLNEATNSVKTRSSGSTRVRAHSVFMAVSWTVLVPLAILLIKFFERGNALGFQVHRSLNFTAGLFTIIGLLLVVFQSNIGGRHAVLGYIVCALVIIQVILGIVRPKMDAGGRKPWYYAHAILGGVAVSLGYLNTFYGIDLDYFGSRTILIVLTSLSLITYVLLVVLFGFTRGRKRSPTTQQNNDATDSLFVEEEGNHLN